MIGMDAMGCSGRTGDGIVGRRRCRRRRRFAVENRIGTGRNGAQRFGGPSLEAFVGNGRRRGCVVMAAGA